MSHPILRRFRQEVREREDISPNDTIVLTDDPARTVNTLAAKLLLEEVFHGRITIKTGPKGLICGSREEAGSKRLQTYTTDSSQDDSMLLSSLTLLEVETYLKQKTGKQYKAYIPDTAEVRFIMQLAEEFEDIKYGI